MTTNVMPTAEVEKIWIPAVADSEIRRRAKHIVPLVEGPKGGLWTIKMPNLFNVSYIWDPKRLKRAGKLEEAFRLTTYHEYGHPSLFKPSIAEVLAQLKDEQMEGIVAFQLVGTPEDVDDLNKHKEALNEGYHVAQAIFYRKAA